MLASILIFALSAWSMPEEPCALFLLGTPNSVHGEKAHSTDFEAWASLPTTIDYLQIFHDVREFLIKAPQEVRDVLGLAGALTTADRPRDEAYTRRLAEQYMVAELEVFFGTEVGELAATMRALEGLHEHLSPEARAYMEGVTAHPSRGFVLSLLLHTLNEDLKKQRPDPDYRRLRSGQSWLPPNLTLRDMMTSTPALVEQFVRSFHRLTHPTLRTAAAFFSTNDNPVKAPREADPSDEPMLRWVAEKLYNHDLRSEPNRPPAWLKFYKEACEFLRTPVSQNPKVQFVGGVRITQSVLTPTADGVASIVEDFDRKVVTDFHEHYGNLLVFAPVGDDRSLWNRDRLDFAFAQDALALPWGVSVFAAMVNLEEPVISGKDLPILAINQMRRLVIQRLKEYFPVREITHENQGESRAVAPAWGPHFESPFWAEVFQPPPPTQAPANEDLHLSFFVDGMIPLKALKSGVRYSVEFRRPNANFGGAQTFVFESAALDAMMKDMGKSIPPITWLQAIVEGIARSHGQAGVKILNQGGSREKGLRFEVKIMSSPYRIFGHLANRQWTLEYIADEH